MSKLCAGSLLLCLCLSFPTSIVLVASTGCSSDMGQYLGMDIGGTLVKVVYFEHSVDTPQYRRPRTVSYARATEEISQFLTDRGAKYRDEALKCYSEELGGSLHFLRFETRRMQQALEAIAGHGIHQNVIRMACTGGGAHKYENLMEEIVGISLDKHDELECLLLGLNFLLVSVPNSLYSFKNVDFRTLKATEISCPTPTEDEGGFYPFLLVNIGSGVSMLKVSDKCEYERVSGTSVGGGTYWGMCRLLTKCGSFEEVLELAEQGDNTAVDLMLRDTFRVRTGRFQLPSNTVASSFGKLAITPELWKSTRPADLARALLYMITFHIAQISNKTAAFAIDYWSGGAFQAQFFRHEGYFGALGAFLKSLNLDEPKKEKERKSIRRETGLNFSDTDEEEEEETESVRQED